VLLDPQAITMTATLDAINAQAQRGG